MANSKSATKSYKQAERRSVFNLRRNRAMRKAVKDARDFVVQKDAKAAEAALPSVFQAIDKAAKRGVIKANAAARKKSRLVAAIAKLK